MRALSSFALALAAPAALGLASCAPPPAPVGLTRPPVAAPAASVAAPPTADPAPRLDGDVTVASVNGVNILIKRIPGAELAATQLYIKGGARDWSAADAGIGRLALAVATSGGTEALDKDAFSKRLAVLGSELTSVAGEDFGALQAKSLATTWDETFGLVVDTFLRPALPAGEIEVQRQRQIAALRHEQEDPNSFVDLRSHALLFKGHPFENRALGTEASVAKLSAPALRAHLAKLREGSRLLLVAVGDVDPSHVIEAARGAFAAVPRGAFESTPVPPLHFDKALLVTTERKLETNYIEGAFPAPGWRDPDYPEAMVAMSVLRDRVFDEVRTKRNLSYAPSAWLMGDSAAPLGFLYVTATDPNATMKVMLDEARRLQNEPVPAKDLVGAKATFLSRHLVRNESTAGQASMLANAELIGGDWKLARTLPDRIRAVTPAALQAYAKKYVGRLQVVVVGDPSKIDRALFESL